MEKLEWLVQYMGRKLEEIEEQKYQPEISVSEKAFLRADMVLVKYNKDLALLYACKYAKILNSKNKQCTNA